MTNVTRFIPAGVITAALFAVSGAAMALPSNTPYPTAPAHAVQAAQVVNQSAVQSNGGVAWNHSATSRNLIVH